MHEAFHDFTTNDAANYCDVVTDSAAAAGVEIIGPAWDDAPFDEDISNRATERVSGFLGPMEAAGCSVDYVNIDGPLKTMVAGLDDRPEDEEDTDEGFDSFEKAAPLLVDFVVGLREEFPGLTVRILPNFPNWGWNGEPSVTGQEWGDYAEAFHIVVDEFRNRDVDLAGLVVDHPYDYPEKDRVFELRDLVHDWDLEFHMIVNSEEGGNESDARFAEDTLVYVEYLQERELDPDGYIVESWYEYPQANVPESDETTMTGVTKSLLDRRA